MRGFCVVEFSNGRLASSDSLMQHHFCSSAGLWTCGTRDQKAFGKISLTRGIHCCPIFFFLFFRPASPYCAQCVHNTCTHLPVYRLYMNYRCYQITQEWKIFTQIGAMRRADWVFIVGAPVWRWLGEYVTVGGTFYSLLLTGSSSSNTVTATLTATVTSVSHFSTRP